MEKNVDHYLEKPKKKKKLDKYLSNDAVKPKAAKNFKIIDDDIDINSLAPTLEAEILVDMLDPEGPAIVDNGLIRDEEVKGKVAKKIDMFTNNKWIKVDVIENEDGDLMVADELDQHNVSSKSLFKKRGEKNKTNQQTPSNGDNDDDLDVPRRKDVKVDSDGDLSPVRPKANKPASMNRSKGEDRDSDLDDIPRRKHAKKDSDNDLDEIPRKKSSNRRDSDGDLDDVPRRHSIKRDPDGDLSPVRKSDRDHNSRSKRKSAERDLSPVRKSVNSTVSKAPVRVKTEKPSPVLFGKERKRSTSPNASKIKVKKEKEASPERKPKKGEEEIDEDRIIRLRKPKEVVDEAKKAKEEELKKKYDEWKKGLVQVKQHEEKIKDYLHEVEKPLARHADDKDLEDLLKKQEREDDPMLEYMRKNQASESSNDASKPVKKVYRGPPAPPNRYNIMPGSKWDGVDRSNGFEKKYFESITAKKVRQEEAYKWSTEDM